MKQISRCKKENLWSPMQIQVGISDWGEGCNGGKLPPRRSFELPFFIPSCQFDPRSGASSISVNRHAVRFAITIIIRHTIDFFYTSHLDLLRAVKMDIRTQWWRVLRSNSFLEQDPITTDIDYGNSMRKIFTEAYHIMAQVRAVDGMQGKRCFPRFTRQ